MTPKRDKLIALMDTWTPLWSKIVDSSIWTEPDNVCKVFVTMLALKDSDHVVRYNAFQLAQRAHKTEAEVLAALKVLAAPDKHRIEKQPFEGRRIEKITDGWLMLNGQAYRDKMSEEMKKARWRRAQAAKRERSNMTSGISLAGETANVKMFADGKVDKHFQPISQ